MNKFPVGIECLTIFSSLNIGMQTLEFAVYNLNMGCQVIGVKNLV